MTNRKNLKKAFTLVEMMIVVAIIAVLAGIAVPQYNKYVKKSEATEAIRFMKQIVDAQGIYFSTHGKYIANDAANNEGLKVIGTEINADGKFKNFKVTVCGSNAGLVVQAWDGAAASADETKSVYMFYPRGYSDTVKNYTGNEDLYDGQTFLYNYINEEDSTNQPACP